MKRSKKDANRVTLKDIAKKTGYTITTVSHSLHNKTDIAEATKQYICDIADQMGYITNSAASSLRSGKTNTIAIIVPDISNPHIAYQVKCIELEAKKKNYSTIILNTDEDIELEKDSIKTSYEKRVDGILICPTQQNTENITYLKGLKIPFVLIGRYFDNVDTSYVCCDDVKSGYLAGRYMLEKGCRHILYIGAYSYISVSQKRLLGIEMSIKELGDKSCKLINCSISPKFKPEDEIIPYLNKNSVDFDSIIIFSDMLAYRIIHNMNENNQLSKIPVVSFDNVQYHMPLPFHHTSVGMMELSWAEKAFGILYNEINGISNKQNKVLIDVSLKSF